MSALIGRGCALVLSVGFIVAGCTDIFHSTDFPTLCDATPSASGCAEAGAADATAEPLCAKTSAAASALARSTCAKLSACSAVTPEWNVATCLDDASLAFDCSANPNMAALGQRRTFWACARAAKDCAAVERCHFAGSLAPRCGTSARDYATCAGDGVRVLCSGAGGAPVAFESCGAQGRSCRDGRCGSSATTSCPEQGCEGTRLRTCTLNNIDVGFDCALFGGGKCSGDGQASACVPSQGASCTNSTAVRCEGNVAIACTGGIEQRVNCASLGLPCSGGEISAEGAVSGCKGDVDCGPDACSGTTMQTCARRTTRALDCAAAGFGPCTTQSFGGVTFSRCTPNP